MQIERARLQACKLPPFTLPRHRPPPPARRSLALVCVSMLHAEKVTVDTSKQASKPASKQASKLASS